MIYDKVVEMIADQLSISKDKITRQSRLFEDLNADSANVMMLILDLEQKFGVSVEDDVLSNMRMKVACCRPRSRIHRSRRSIGRSTISGWSFWATRCLS